MRALFLTRILLLSLLSFCFSDIDVSYGIDIPLGMRTVSYFKNFGSYVDCNSQLCTSDTVGYNIWNHRTGTRLKSHFENIRLPRGFGSGDPLIVSNMGLFRIDPSSLKSSLLKASTVPYNLCRPVIVGKSIILCSDRVLSISLNSLGVDWELTYNVSLPVSVHLSFENRLYVVNGLSVQEIDLRSGQQMWSYSFSETLLGVSINNYIVVVTATSIIELSVGGQFLWSKNLPDKLVAEAGVSEDKDRVFVSVINKVVCYSVFRGELLWSKPVVGVNGHPFVSPYDKLLVSTSGGALFQLTLDGVFVDATQFSYDSLSAHKDEGFVVLNFDNTTVVCDSVLGMKSSQLPFNAENYRLLVLQNRLLFYKNRDVAHLYDPHSRSLDVISFPMNYSTLTFFSTTRFTPDLVLFHVSVGGNSSRSLFSVSHNQSYGLVIDYNCIFAPAPFDLSGPSVFVYCDTILSKYTAYFEKVWSQQLHLSPSAYTHLIAFPNNTVMLHYPYTVLRRSTRLYFNMADGALIYQYSVGDIRSPDATLTGSVWVKDDVTEFLDSTGRVVLETVLEQCEFLENAFGRGNINSDVEQYRYHLLTGGLFLNHNNLKNNVLVFDTLENRVVSELMVLMQLNALSGRAYIDFYVVNNRHPTIVFAFGPLVFVSHRNEIIWTIRGEIVFFLYHPDLQLLYITFSDSQPLVVDVPALVGSYDRHHPPTSGLFPAAHRYLDSSFAFADRSLSVFNSATGSSIVTILLTFIGLSSFILLLLVVSFEMGFLKLPFDSVWVPKRQLSTLLSVSAVGAPYISKAAALRGGLLMEVSKLAGEHLRSGMEPISSSDSDSTSSDEDAESRDLSDMEPDTPFVERRYHHQTHPNSPIAFPSDSSTTRFADLDFGIGRRESRDSIPRDGGMPLPSVDATGFTGTSIERLQVVGVGGAVLTAQADMLPSRHSRSTSRSGSRSSRRDERSLDVPAGSVEHFTSTSDDVSRTEDELTTDGEYEERDTIPEQLSFDGIFSPRVRRHYRGLRPQIAVDGTLPFPLVRSRNHPLSNSSLPRDLVLNPTFNPISPSQSTSNPRPYEFDVRSTSYSQSNTLFGLPELELRSESGSVTSASNSSVETSTIIGRTINMAAQATSNFQRRTDTIPGRVILATNEDPLSAGPSTLHHNRFASSHYMHSQMPSSQVPLNLPPPPVPPSVTSPPISSRFHGTSTGYRPAYGHVGRTYTSGSNFTNGSRSINSIRFNDNSTVSLGSDYEHVLLSDTELDALGR